LHDEVASVRAGKTAAARAIVAVAETEGRTARATARDDEAIAERIIFGMVNNSGE